LFFKHSLGPQKLLTMKNYMFLLLGLLVVACQPEPDNLKLLDEFVVSTNYDPSANFSAYETFSLPVDTIGFYSNRSNDTILTHANSSLVRPILERVNANLVARGYTRVGKTESPQLGMNVLIVNDINLFQQVVYPGAYYPYYGGYYGYGSAFFYNYPYVQTYASNTGALVVEMVDLVNRTPDNKVKVIWSAYMGDIISTIDRLRQCEEGIDQAFIQSPYIGN
jgi:hypothetical protein